MALFKVSYSINSIWQITRLIKSFGQTRLLLHTFLYQPLKYLLLTLTKYTSKVFPKQPLSAVVLLCVFVIIPWLSPDIVLTTIVLCACDAILSPRIMIYNPFINPTLSDRNKCHGGLLWKDCTKKYIKSSHRNYK